MWNTFYMSLVFFWVRLSTFMIFQNSALCLQNLQIHFTSTNFHECILMSKKVSKKKSRDISRYPSRYMHKWGTQTFVWGPNNLFTFTLRHLFAYRYINHEQLSCTFEGLTFFRMCLLFRIGIFWSILDN